METNTPSRARGVLLAFGLASALTLTQLGMGNGSLSLAKKVQTVASPNVGGGPVQAQSAEPVNVTAPEVQPLPSVPATAPVATTVPPPPAPPALVIPTDPSQWFNPRGDHEGTEGIATDLAKLGVANNSPLYVNECWGRTWGAATSDHHASQTRSWACDLSVIGVQVPTPQADEAARRIASALAVPNWKGGEIVKVINGYRIQVLWRVAGHFNHVHVGVRKQ